MMRVGVETETYTCVIVAARRVASRVLNVSSTERLGHWGVLELFFSGSLHTVGGNMRKLLADL